MNVSDNGSGMAVNILFKTPVETTEQMTQNWTFRNPRVKEKHVTCEVVISSFHIILYLKTLVEAT